MNSFPNYHRDHHRSSKHLRLQNTVAAHETSAAEDWTYPSSAAEYPPPLVYASPSYSWREAEDGEGGVKGSQRRREGRHHRGPLPSPYKRDAYTARRKGEAYGERYDTEEKGTREEDAREMEDVTPRRKEKRRSNPGDDYYNSGMPFSRPYSIKGLPPPFSPSRTLSFDSSSSSSSSFLSTESQAYTSHQNARKTRRRRHEEGERKHQRKPKPLSTSTEHDEDDERGRSISQETTSLSSSWSSSSQWRRKERHRRKSHMMAGASPSPPSLPSRQKQRVKDTSMRNAKRRSDLVEISSTDTTDESREKDSSIATPLAPPSTTREGRAVRKAMRGQRKRGEAMVPHYRTVERPTRHSKKEAYMEQEREESDAVSYVSSVKPSASFSSSGHHILQSCLARTSRTVQQLSKVLQDHPEQEGTERSALWTTSKHPPTHRNRTPPPRVTRPSMSHVRPTRESTTSTPILSTKRKVHSSTKDRTKGLLPHVKQGQVEEQKTETPPKRHEEDTIPIARYPTTTQKGKGHIPLLSVQVSPSVASTADTSSTSEASILLSYSVCSVERKLAKYTLAYHERQEQSLASVNGVTPLGLYKYPRPASSASDASPSSGTTLPSTERTNPQPRTAVPPRAYSSAPHRRHGSVHRVATTPDDPKRPHRLAQEEQGDLNGGERHGASNAARQKKTENRSADEVPPTRTVRGSEGTVEHLTLQPTTTSVHHTNEKEAERHVHHKTKKRIVDDLLPTTEKNHIKPDPSHTEKSKDSATPSLKATPGRETSVPLRLRPVPHAPPPPTTSALPLSPSAEEVFPVLSLLTHTPLSPSRHPPQRITSLPPSPPVFRQLVLSSNSSFHAISQGEEGKNGVELSLDVERGRTASYTCPVLNAEATPKTAAARGTALSPQERPHVEEASIDVPQTLPSCCTGMIRTTPVESSFGARWQNVFTAIHQLHCSPPPPPSDPSHSSFYACSLLRKKKKKSSGKASETEKTRSEAASYTSSERHHVFSTATVNGQQTQDITHLADTPKATAKHEMEEEERTFAKRREKEAERRNSREAAEEAWESTEPPQERNRVSPTSSSTTTRPSPSSPPPQGGKHKVPTQQEYASLHTTSGRMKRVPQEKKTSATTSSLPFDKEEEAKRQPAARHELHQSPDSSHQDAMARPAQHPPRASSSPSLLPPTRGTSTAAPHRHSTRHTNSSAVRDATSSRKEKRGQVTLLRIGGRGTSAVNTRKGEKKTSKSRETRKKEEEEEKRRRRGKLHHDPTLPLPTHALQSAKEALEHEKKKREEYKEHVERERKKDAQEKAIKEVEWEEESARTALLLLHAEEATAFWSSQTQALGRWVTEKEKKWEISMDAYHRSSASSAAELLQLEMNCAMVEEKLEMALEEKESLHESHMQMLRQHVEEAEKYAAQRKEYEDTMEQMKQEFQQQQETWETEKETMTETARSEMRNLDQEFTTTIASYKELLEEASKKMDSLKRIARRHKTLKKTMETKEQEWKEEKEKELEEERKKWQERVHEMAEAHATAAAAAATSVATHQSQVEQLEQHVAHHEQELTMARAREQEAVKQAQALREDVELLQHKLEEQEKSFRDATTAAAAKEIEWQAALTEKTAELHAKQRIADDTITALKRQLKEKDQKLCLLAASSNEPIQRLRGQLEEERKRRVQVEGQLSSLRRRAKEAEEKAAREMRKELLCGKRSLPFPRTGGAAGGGGDGGGAPYTTIPVSHHGRDGHPGSLSPLVSLTGRPPDGHDHSFLSVSSAATTSTATTSRRRRTSREGARTPTGLATSSTVKPSASTPTRSPPPSSSKTEKEAPRAPIACRPSSSSSSSVQALGTLTWPEDVHRQQEGEARSCPLAPQANGDAHQSSTPSAHPVECSHTRMGEASQDSEAKEMSITSAKTTTTASRASVSPPGARSPTHRFSLSLSPIHGKHHRREHHRGDDEKRHRKHRLQKKSKGRPRAETREKTDGEEVRALTPDGSSDKGSLSSSSSGSESESSEGSLDTKALRLVSMQFRTDSTRTERANEEDVGGKRGEQKIHRSGTARPPARSKAPWTDAASPSHAATATISSPMPSTSISEKEGANVKQSEKETGEALKRMSSSCLFNRREGHCSTSRDRRRQRSGSRSETSSLTRSALEGSSPSLHGKPLRHPPEGLVDEEKEGSHHDALDGMDFTAAQLLQYIRDSREEFLSQCTKVVHEASGRGLQQQCEG